MVGFWVGCGGGVQDGGISVGMVDRSGNGKDEGVFSERPSHPVTMSICRYVGMFRHIAATEQNTVRGRVDARNRQKHGENTLVSGASVVVDPP